MRIELISHYTPLGASAMLLESATDVFFNQHTQLPDFRNYFAVSIMNMMFKQFF